MSAQQDLAAIVYEYEETLRDLTFNSKPLIDSLSQLAGENRNAAASIAALIERNIAQAPTAQRKLPLFYLMDSIVKNVREPYISHFSRNLPEIFCTCYRADALLQQKLERLFQTWHAQKVFQPRVLAAIEKQLPELGAPHVNPRVANSPAAGGPSQGPGAGAKRPAGPAAAAPAQDPRVGAAVRVDDTGKGAQRRPTGSQSDKYRRVEGSIEQVAAAPGSGGGRGPSGGRGEKGEKGASDKGFARGAPRAPRPSAGPSLPLATAPLNRPPSPPMGTSIRRGAWNPAAGSMPASRGGHDFNDLPEYELTSQLPPSVLPTGPRGPWAPPQVGGRPPLAGYMQSTQAVGLPPGATPMLGLALPPGPMLMPAQGPPMQALPMRSTTPPLPNTAGEMAAALAALGPADASKLLSNAITEGGLNPATAPAAPPPPMPPPAPQPNLPPLGNLLSALGGAPSGAVPAAPPGAMAAKAAPSAASVSSLLGSLMQSGALGGAASTLPAPPARPVHAYGVAEAPHIVETHKWAPIGDKFSTALLKNKSEAVIAALYDHYPVQCQICGLRMLEQATLSKHLDWHFMRRQPKKIGVATSERGWFVAVEQWLQGVRELGKEEEGPPEEEAEEEQARHSIPIGDEQEAWCALCSEQFEVFLHADEEWHYEDAVRITEEDAAMVQLQPGALIHSKCRPSTDLAVKVVVERSLAADMAAAATTVTPRLAARAHKAVDWDAATADAQEDVKPDATRLEVQFHRVKGGSSSVGSEGADAVDKKPDISTGLDPGASNSGGLQINLSNARTVSLRSADNKPDVNAEGPTLSVHGYEQKPAIANMEEWEEKPDIRTCVEGTQQSKQGGSGDNGGEASGEWGREGTEWTSDTQQCGGEEGRQWGTSHVQQNLGGEAISAGVAGAGGGGE